MMHPVDCPTRKPVFHIICQDHDGPKSNDQNNNAKTASFQPGLDVISVITLDAFARSEKIALRIARDFAAQGERTLLVDLDLRTSRLNGLATVTAPKGLSESVRDNQAFTNALEDNLDILHTGAPLADIPAFLLSRGFKQFFHSLKEGYDKIVLVTPPLNQYKDALIISNYASGEVVVHTQAVA